MGEDVKFYAEESLMLAGKIYDIIIVYFPGGKSYGKCRCAEQILVQIPNGFLCGNKNCVENFQVYE